MSLYLKLTTQLKESLLAREVLTTEVLRLLKSYVLAEAKKNNLSAEEIEDSLVLSCLRRQIKGYEEAYRLYAEHRRQADLQQKEAELLVLKSLLPVQLSEDALKVLVEEVISAENLSLKPENFGTIIKAVLSKVGTQTDSRQVAQVLKNLTQN